MRAPDRAAVSLPLRLKAMTLVTRRPAGRRVERGHLPACACAGRPGTKTPPPTTATNNSTATITYRSLFQQVPPPCVVKCFQQTQFHDTQSSGLLCLQHIGHVHIHSRRACVEVTQCTRKIDGIFPRLKIEREPVAVGCRFRVATAKGGDCTHVTSTSAPLIRLLRWQSFVEQALAHCRRKLPRGCCASLELSGSHHPHWPRQPSGSVRPASCLWARCICVQPAVLLL